MALGTLGLEDIVGISRCRSCQAPVKTAAIWTRRTSESTLELMELHRTFIGAIQAGEAAIGKGRFWQDKLNRFAVGSLRVLRDVRKQPLRYSCAGKAC